MPMSQVAIEPEDYPTCPNCHHPLVAFDDLIIPCGCYCHMSVQEMNEWLLTIEERGQDVG